MQDLNEAEVAGDVPAVRSLLSRLRNRSVFPAKVLIFHEDARPGYFGTWTRNSKEVGPRTPFSRDVVSLDYGVDSGEEWEEEEEGDVLDNEDDEDGAATDERDSDLDSWLVDDDDELAEPGTPIDERFGSPDFFPPLATKRKAKESGEGERSLEGKKRKTVIPLVPFTKGPCWEARIGECSYEPFNAYRIHFLNGVLFTLTPEHELI
jgi:chromatin assembly factor 1 subunit A